MSDEKAPRIRGQKEREAAYRAGFVDGIAHAHAEAKRLREVEEDRATAIDIGLQKYRRTMSAEPRRTRRKRENDVAATLDVMATS